MTSSKTLPALLGALLLGGPGALLFLLKGAGTGRAADEGPPVALPGAPSVDRESRAEPAQLTLSTPERTVNR